VWTNAAACIEIMKIVYTIKIEVVSFVDKCRSWKRNVICKCLLSKVDSPILATFHDSMDPLQKMPTLTPRPPLPVRHANPHISTTSMSPFILLISYSSLLLVNSGVLPPVKYQILNCQGQDILVSLSISRRSCCRLFLSRSVV
jgi:hypothetical protein